MHIPTYLTVFPLFRHTPQDTVGRLGEPAVLNCSALAIPPPDYEWSVNGDVFFTEKNNTGFSGKHKIISIYLLHATFMTYLL